MPDGLFACELVPLRGREAVIAKQVYAEATHLIRTRWLGSQIYLTPLHRFVRTDPVTSEVRTFGLLAVNNIETRNRGYEMVAQEIQQIQGIPEQGGQNPS